MSAPAIEFRITPHKEGCPAAGDVEATCHCLRAILPMLPVVTAAAAHQTWGSRVGAMLRSGVLERRADGRFYLSRLFSLE